MVGKNNVKYRCVCISNVSRTNLKQYRLIADGDQIVK